MIITEEWIKRFSTSPSVGSWTNAQRRAIGCEDGSSGWIQRMAGKEITEDQRLEFESFGHKRACTGKISQCTRCGNEAMWVDTDQGWRLKEPDGSPHECEWSYYLSKEDYMRLKATLEPDQMWAIYRMMSRLVEHTECYPTFQPRRVLEGFIRASFKVKKFMICCEPKLWKLYSFDPDDWETDEDGVMTKNNWKKR
jgi:hypothetical protein